MFSFGPKFRNTAVSAALGITLLMSGGVAVGNAQGAETVVLAGGCFWCVESDFDSINGVLETVSGYTGGTLDNPTYKDVTAGDTGHYEAVEITFDPDVVKLDALLHAFWRSVDPTDAGGQFCDRGQSYSTAIFADASQKTAAEASKTAAMNDLGREIVTPILDAATFFPAEDYHQNYHNKNSVKYNFYRWSCGRNQTVEKVWGEKAYDGIAH